MAKKSQVARDKKRLEIVSQYAEKRAKLVAIIKDGNVNFEDRQEAYRQLGNLPRDASPTRITRRCRVTGRARGVYRKFEMSRIIFREYAHLGFLPGVTKSSW